MKETIVVLAVLGGLTFGAGDSTESVASGEATPPFPASILEECDGTCSVCPTWGGHMASETEVDPWAQEGENGWHACQGGDTCSGHECDPGGGGEEDGDEEAIEQAAILDRLGVAVLKGDVESLSELLEQGEISVQYVSEREAIQVYGCRGEVVVHFSLTPGNAQSLERLMAVE